MMPSLKSIKIPFLREAKNIEKELIGIRRHLHQFPELSNREYDTSAFIRSKLSEYGIQEFSSLSGTGVLARIKGGKEGKTVAIRADIDALPVTEETGLAYASVNPGVMHACGHDVHTAVALGCAKLLNTIKAQLAGNITLIFQPAEERLTGAQAMIDDGALENPGVDAIMGLHSWPDIPAGTIGIRKGPLMAAADIINIRVYGNQGHAAHPHKCVDPIVISGQIVNTLQTVVSREISPLEPLVITIGKIQGGTAPNIIPHMVEMNGTVRVLNPQLRKRIPEILTRVVQGTAQAMRGDAEIYYQLGTPPVISDEALYRLIEENTKVVLGDENLVYLANPSMGGEDFAFYLEKVPGVFFRLGTYNETLGERFPLHSPFFTVDEACLSIGVAVMCRSVYSYLMVE
jgi:amidohydrolase